MGDWTTELRQRLASLHLRPEREAEIVEELSQHLDEQVRERVAAGASVHDAKREALADLDEPGALAGRLRDIERRVTQPSLPPGAQARGLWLAQAWQDLRLTLRTTRQRPWFSLAVLVTLALTIGPATAIVSVGNWLLWTPSRAVTDADRLVVVWSGRWDGPGSVRPSGVSYSNLADIRAASTTLSSLSGWQESQAGIALPGEKPRTAQVGFVSGNFFDVLGVRPAAGRLLTPEDDELPFGRPVAVVSHGVAVRAFGTPEAAVDQTMHVNGRPLTIVGVAAQSFEGASPSSQVSVWYTGATWTYVNHGLADTAARFQTRSDGLFYTFIGRLAAGRTAAEAQAELDVIFPRLAERHPDANAKFTEARARVFPGLGPSELMRATLTSQVNGLLLVAAALLLLGCANVANLLIAESTRTRREHAVRLALGASRSRLFRQQLTQSVTLSLMGAALGVALAVVIKQMVQVGLMPGLSTAPVPPVVHMDWLVLSVTTAVAVATGVLAGIAPGLLATRVPLTGSLGAGATRSVTGVPVVRAALAALQLALSLALVTGATLLAVTLQNMGRVDTGFNPEGVIVQWVSVYGYGFTPERSRDYATQLHARLQGRSEFDDVSLATGFPFAASRRTRVLKPGGVGSETPSVYQLSTDARFPTLLGLTVKHGRYFDDDEMVRPARQSGDPVVVSETMARQLFGRDNVVGERVTLARTLSYPATDLLVVGVMADTLTRSLTTAPDPVMYLPLMNEDLVSQSAILLRTRASVRQVNELVSTAAFEIDPTLPQGTSRSLVDWIGRGYATTVLFAKVVGSVSVVALVLAAVGLYGLLAQVVGERRREFGIRLAIGASARHVVRLVARQAATIAAVGIALGGALVFWGIGLVESYLWGVEALDPRVMATTIVVLLGVVALAAMRPAWLATRVNPIETLRAE